LIFPNFQDIKEELDLIPIFQIIVTFDIDIPKIERFLLEGILPGEYLISLNTKMEKKKEGE